MALPFDFEKERPWLTALAREAAERLRKARDEWTQVKYQDDRDVKLQADVESERWICEQLSEKFSLPIYAEEEGGEQDLFSGNEYFWVIDPLDGTYNYLRGQRAWAVSIGLMRGTCPILGVIYDAATDQLFFGGKSTGLFINDQRRIPSWSESHHNSCLMTGFPAGMSLENDSLIPFMEVTRKFKKVRMIGSAAAALATVAEGVADAYYEHSVRIWDVAAGLALVEAAGGKYHLKEVAGVFLGFEVWAGKENLLCC